MKILITGGTGFVGSRLAKELKKKHKVFVFDRNVKNVISGINYIKGDIINYSDVMSAVKGKDVVYHLAANLDESSPKEKLFDVNVGGAINIVEACKNVKTKKLIFMSTCGVIGETTEKADEKAPYNPQTNYEKSKTFAERTVLEYYKRYKLPFIIVRSALIYGPNEYWLKIFEKAKKSFPIVGSGKNKMHMVYIKNVLGALVKALKEGKHGWVYIVADDDVYTYEEVYRIIRKMLGIEKKPRHISVFFAKLMAFFYRLFRKKSVVTKEHIDRLVRNRWYSIKRAKLSLKYKPKYSLEKGMQETFKYFNDSRLLQED